MKQTEKILQINDKEIYTMRYEPDEGENFPLIVLVRSLTIETVCSAVLFFMHKKREVSLSYFFT